MPGLRPLGTITRSEMRPAVQSPEQAPWPEPSVDQGMRPCVQPVLPVQSCGHGGGNCTQPGPDLPLGPGHDFGSCSPMLLSFTRGIGLRAL